MRNLFTLLGLAFCSISYSASFTSNQNGGWGNPIWTIVGVDADGRPDGDDDVVIAHTVSLNTNGFSRSVTIDPGAQLNLNNFFVSINGNFTVNGTLAFSGRVYINSTGTFSAAAPISGNNWDLYIQGGTVTIAAGTTVQNISNLSVSAAATVNNNGDITTLSTMTLAGTWNNLANSILRVRSNISGTGILNASGNPNTVQYSTNGYNTVKSATYHHLTLSASGSLQHQKTLSGAITVNGNLTINSPVFLSAAGFAITLGGNWTNNANINHSLATVNLNGSGTQTIARWTSTEVFSTLQQTGTGTVQLGNGIGGYTGAIRVTTAFSQSDGTFDVSASNYAVRIDGSWNRTGGTFNARNGTVTFQGTAAQTLNGSVTTDFYNLTSSNAAGVSFVTGTYNITNILTCTTGTLTHTGGTVTLVSTAGATAIVGNGGGSYAGTYILQRFISARAANWHDFSSAVTATTLADWDGTGTPGELYLSGVNGPDGDACCPLFYSVNTYDEPSATYSPVTQTTTALTVGKGYTIWLADDETSWPALRTMDTRGTPNSGTQVLGAAVISYSGASPDPGGNLVGNPFHASINWASVTKTNVSGTFYMLDATGNYTAFSGSATIPPTQGFFIYATGPGASLSIPQSAKLTSTSSTFNRIIEPYNLKLNLTCSETPFSQEVTINFDETASLGYEDVLDAYFVKSPNKKAPNLTLVMDGSNQLIKSTFNPSDDVSLPLRARASVSGMYTITAFRAEFIEEYACVLLEDVFANKIIDLKKQPEYSFYMAENDNPNRFVLHLLKKETDCEQTLAKSKPEYFNPDMVRIVNYADGAFIQFDLDEATNAEIAVYNMLGETVSISNHNAFKQTIELNTSGASGFYIVKVTVGSNVVTEKVFVTQK
ncbi:MAG: T9SS type A sorting domain-containing protein [Bacteroidota bacterium]